MIETICLYATQVRTRCACVINSTAGLTELRGPRWDLERNSVYVLQRVAFLFFELLVISIHGRVQYTHLTTAKINVIKALKYHVHRILLLQYGGGVVVFRQIDELVAALRAAVRLPNGLTSDMQIIDFFSLYLRINSLFWSRL